MIHLKFYGNFLKQTLHLSFPNIRLMSCLLNQPSDSSFPICGCFIFSVIQLCCFQCLLSCSGMSGPLVIKGINNRANIRAEESPCWTGTRKSRSLFISLCKSFGWQGVQWIWKSWELKYNQLAPLNARLVLEGALWFPAAVMQACV